MENNLIAFENSVNEKFNDFYLKNKNKLLFYVKGKIFNELDAEDVVDECFIKLLNKINNFDENKATILTYLYNIAKNLTYDYNIKYNDSVIDYNSNYIDYLNNEDKLYYNEVDDVDDVEYYKLKSIKTAYNKLSKMNKNIINMRFYNDMKYIEISKALNIPLDTVKTRIRYSINNLKKHV